MRLQIFLCLAFGLLLSACGGGGGGGGGASNPPPATPPPSGGGGGGGGGSPEPGNATARIAFPQGPSVAIKSSVVVRGKAADPEGVAAVRVNGIAATIVTPSAAASSGGIAASKGFASTLSEHDLEDEDAIEWVVELELDSGDNEVVVEVENADGAVTEEADTTQIRYNEVPTDFTLDADRTRVVGLGSKVELTSLGQHLVEHNYGSGEQAVIADMPGSRPTCFRGHNDQFLSLVQVEQDQWELHSLDVGEGQASIMASIPEQALDPGEDFEPAPHWRRLVCSDDHEHAYALVNYSATNGPGFGSAGFAKSRVLRIALFPPNDVSVLTETDVTASPRWLSMDIALAADTIVSLADLNSIAPLTAIALADGERSVLTPGLDVGGMALAPVLDQDLVYVATFAGVDKVEIDAPAKANISEVEPDDTFAFAQVRSLAYDVANGRLIVGDSDLDALIAVDAITGERSDFVSRRIGSGPPVIAPRRIVLSSDGSTAYVADDGGNVAERLFAIDLATGDRVQIGDIDETANYTLQGLAIDEVGAKAFVSRNSSIREVNLENGDTRVVARPGSVMAGSLFEAIGPLAFDAAQNRLLIGDFGLQAIVAIDLASDQQSILSQHGVRGEGEEAFGAITAISLDEDAGVAYVSNQLSDTILRVDLETGDRELFATTCPLPQQETLNQVLYDAVHNELLIVSDGLFIHDLDTNVCTEVPLAAPLKFGLLNVQVAPDDRLLGAILGALMQVDRPSGDAVIVSR